MRLQWHFEYCYARFGFVDLAQGRALPKGVGEGGAGVARKVVWKLKWVTGTLKCSLFYQSYFPLRFVSSSKLKAAGGTKKREGGLDKMR